MSEVMDIEMIAMQVILAGGNARNEGREALKMAKEGRFAEAEECLRNGDLELAKAHDIQTGLIQQEAGGNSIPVKLLMVHAQDHYMSAMSELYLVRELVDLYRKLESK